MQLTPFQLSNFITFPLTLQDSNSPHVTPQGALDYLIGAINVLGEMVETEKAKTRFMEEKLEDIRANDGT